MVQIIPPQIKAEELLLSDNITDQIAAMQIFTILGWCKQVNVHLPFDFQSYHMLSRARDSFRKKLNNPNFPQKKVLFSCFKDCILAKYFTFDEIVDDIDMYVKRWEKGEFEIIQIPL
mgnify:CR=1 FL=1